MILMQGKGVAKGVVNGPIYFFQRPDTAISDAPAADIEAEKGKFEAERTTLQGQISDLQGQAAQRDTDLNDLKEKLTAAQAEMESLRSQTQDVGRVTVVESGVFSGQVDGYEPILTPDGLNDLTPSKLAALEDQAVPVGEESLGKLITDTTWYFACTLSEENARRLTEGGKVTVRFSRDWAGDVDMTVERISAPEEGQMAVILSSHRFLSDVTLLRRQTVELVFVRRTGIRVPTGALRVETVEQTDKGTGEVKQVNVACVYVRVGVTAERKPVSILAQGEDAARTRRLLEEGNLTLERVACARTTLAYVPTSQQAGLAEEEEYHASGQEQVDQLIAQKGQLQLEQLLFPAPHQDRAAADRQDGPVVRAVSQEIGGQSVPQGGGDHHHEQQSEIQEHSGRPGVGGRGIGEHHGEGDREDQRCQEIGAQDPQEDAQLHQQDSSSHREALHQGADPRVQLPPGPQGPQAQAELDHGLIQDQQQLKEDLDRVDKGYGGGPGPRGGDQAEQPGHPGGHGDISQSHHPELGVGEGHPLPGLTLECAAVDFHETVLQS